MAWPDWAGPFGVPEDYDELERFLLQSTLLALGALVAIEVGIRFTIPRMAPHAFRNPSLAAIRALAYRQTAYPSITRFLGIVSEPVLARSASLARYGPTPVLGAGLLIGGSVVAAESVVASTASAASGQSPGNPWWIPLPLYLTLFG